MDRAGPVAGKPTCFQRASAARLACLPIALLLSGCFTTIEGGPPRLFSIAEESAVARERLVIREDSYYSAFAAQNKAARNEIIAQRMRAIDTNYYAFEAAILRERQEVGFISSVISIALSGAIPLVNPVATKNALGAVSAGVQGATKAYSDEVLFQKTVQVLATQMRARRDVVAADIVTRMKTLDIEEYPLAMALGDVDEYYAAGTIAGALIEIQKTVSAEGRDSEQRKADAVVRISFGPDSTSDALIRFVYPNGVRAGRDRERSARITSLLRAQGNRTPLSIILFDRSPGAAAIRRSLAREVGIVP
jgi:hypothetical protein